jgi:hypothetical protein
MASRTLTQRLADALLPDGLDRFIADRRLGTAKSWRAISLDLRDATDGQINVTETTLRAWYADEFREPVEASA